MLDSDVAMLYHYKTKRINEAVSRNKERFPENFCFQLTEHELEVLKSQIATLDENKNVEVIILTSQNCNITKLDVKKFNEQYATLKISKTDKFHDRFIIIDNKELYHCGASIKDLGKKCFAINKIEGLDFIENINKVINFYNLFSKLH